MMCPHFWVIFPDSFENNSDHFQAIISLWEIPVPRQHYWWKPGDGLWKSPQKASVSILVPVFKSLHNEPISFQSSVAQAPHTSVVCEITVQRVIPKQQETLLHTRRYIAHQFVTALLYWNTRLMQEISMSGASIQRGVNVTSHAWVAAPSLSPQAFSHNSVTQQRGALCRVLKEKSPTERADSQNPRQL